MRMKTGGERKRLAIACELLTDSDPQYLTCPSPMELCIQAGDADRLQSLARAKDDLLAYAAAKHLAAREIPQPSSGASS